MLDFFGLKLPRCSDVQADAYSRWVEAGCPWNNDGKVNWYGALDNATRYVAQQLYYRRGCPVGADKQNWLFAQLLVRTVVTCDQAWKANEGSRNGTDHAPMGRQPFHYLHALGFHLIGPWQSALYMAAAPSWRLPPEDDVAANVRFRDEMAFKIWTWQGKRHGFDLSHALLAQWLMDISRHAKRRTWTAGAPEGMCPEGSIMATMVAQFLHDPYRAERVITAAAEADSGYYT